MHEKAPAIRGKRQFRLLAAALSYMFITHDLATVCAIADDVVVMPRGEVVRQGEEPVFHTAFPRPCLQLV